MLKLNIHNKFTIVSKVLKLVLKKICHIIKYSQIILLGCIYSMCAAFSLQPTSKNRGWLIDPLGENPWWTLLVAALPALLCTILIFMDQQITAVIINRKEHKLKVKPVLLSLLLHMIVYCT